MKTHPYPNVCPFCKVATLKHQPSRVSERSSSVRVGSYSCGSVVFDHAGKPGTDYCANYGTQPNGRKSGVIRFNVY